MTNKELKARIAEMNKKARIIRFLQKEGLLKKYEGHLFDLVDFINSRVDSF